MNRQHNTIRASEADIILQCGAALTPPKVAIDISGPEATIGQAGHEAIENWIKGGMAGEPQPQPAANQYNVDPADIEMIQNAPAMLARIKEDLRELGAEVTVTGGGVRGRIDVLAMTRCQDGKPFSIAVLDWKTGRDPALGSKPAQRLAYASAVEATYGMPANGYVYTAELWLSPGTIVESRFDIASIEGFRKRLAERRKRRTASPGPHCKYCRRSHECIERQAYVRSTALALTEDRDVATPEMLALLWDQSRALKQALETYEKAVDMAIDEHGALELPDGRKLLHGTKCIDTIDASKAWPILRSHGLDRTEIEAAIKLSKTALLDAIGRKAVRGEKQKAKADLVIALDTAGAIDRKTLKYRRVSAD